MYDHGQGWPLYVNRAAMSIGMMIPSCSSLTNVSHFGFICRRSYISYSLFLRWVLSYFKIRWDCTITPETCILKTSAYDGVKLYPSPYCLFVMSVIKRVKSAKVVQQYSPWMAVDIHVIHAFWHACTHAILWCGMLVWARLALLLLRWCRMGNRCQL